MDLLECPFHVLNASTRDDRRGLRRLADEQSLFGEAELCDSAFLMLTNPRKRLSAELAWFPGVSPTTAEVFMTKLSTSKPEISDSHGFPFIAKANVLAAGMLRLHSCTLQAAKEWIQELAFAFERGSHEQIANLINEDRAVSGFPNVVVNEIGNVLEERRRYYQTVIKQVLDKLESQTLVACVTELIDSATNFGKNPPSLILLSDMVDQYEVEAQAFFDHEEKTIYRLISETEDAAIRKQSDNTISALVDKLIAAVKNWDMIAQPIQVNAKSKGLEHAGSRRLAGEIRNLSITLFNSHGKLDLTKRLTSMMQSVFAEVYTVAERVSEDAVTLSGIEAEQEQAKRDEAAWQREITFSAEYGLIFKEAVSISPKGVMLKGRNWPLESITRVRWGGTRHSVNGIPTKTVFTIRVGNWSDNTQVELSQQRIYTELTSRLWKAVGVRLLFEQLDSWKKGESLQIGGAIISDRGVELDRVKFLSRTKVFCAWSEVVIWNGPGTFCIGKAGDKAVRAELSYLELDNIHVLEAALRLFFKSGRSKPSETLRGNANAG